jgi:arsenate reductase
VHKALQQTIDELVLKFDAIPNDRKTTLEHVASFIAERAAKGRPIELMFICTHNSRRSHMAQLWATVAAAHYGISGVETYSAGTEATAFNPRAVEAMRRVGFVIENPGGDNPRYRARYSSEASAIECFSKRHDDPVNPQRDFVAIMTCSEADEACPIVRGAALRVLIEYDDPKVSDGTSEEAAIYDARSRQIGAEMLFLFSRVAAAK